MNRLCVLLGLILLAGDFCQAISEGRSIDTRHSYLTIHVGKAGLFAAGAHEHWIQAPVASGTVDDKGQSPSIRLSVQAAALTVSPNENISEKDRAEVESNMQNKVLESSKYPAIIFQSTRIETGNHGGWSVTGELTIHGVTKQVTLNVRRDLDGYAGSTRIAQTDFGIKPITIAGGVIKVKDELDIDFHIYTAAGA